MIEERTGIPVVGVVPMEHLDIDDEDSLSDRLNQTQKGAGIDVAVIHLPHISNFTDFSAFERMDGVSLRYVSQPGMLGNPDLILLPGTKNTMDDLPVAQRVRHGSTDPPPGREEDADHRHLWWISASGRTDGRSA